MARLTIDVPDPLVPRFRAIVPPPMTPEEAVVRLIKLAILDFESKAFANTEGQSLDTRVRANRAALVAELGL